MKHVAFCLLFQALLCSAVDWLQWGNHANNDRWADDETKINTFNVDDLTEKWTFSGFGPVSTTPTIKGDHVYFTDWGGGLHDVSLKTGEPYWSIKIEELTMRTGDRSRSAPLIVDMANVSMIVIALNNNGELLAIDRLAPELLWTTVLSDNVCARMTTSPVFADGFIFMGTSGDSYNRLRCPEYRGSAAKVDPMTGEIMWQTWTISDELVKGPNSAIGASVWGRSLSFDFERNLVFVPTSQPHDLPDYVIACEKKRRPDDPSCLPDDLHSNSIIAMDMGTGDIVWSQRLISYDDWNNDCRSNTTSFIYCPDPEGPDADFGQGPIPLDVTDQFGVVHEWMGAGQKSGDYWMLNRDDGRVMWKTNNGGWGYKGGLEFGSASDGKRIYIAQANSENRPFKLKHSTRMVNEVIYGSHYAALDVLTGNILWETPAPIQFNAYAFGPVTVANGLVFAGLVDEEGSMFIIEAATGMVLWEFSCGGSVASGPSISQGTVLWGCGYTDPTSTYSDQLFAFHIPYLEDM